MIFGIGCDIVNIDRINKSDAFLENFQNKILGPEEQAEYQRKILSRPQKAATLAKYFAGKEAFAKALGTGFRDNLFLKDIQILHNALGKPELKLSARAESLIKNISPQAHAFISISDDAPYAQAVVIIEK